MEWLVSLQWYWYIVALALVVAVVFALKFKQFRKIVLEFVIKAENDIKGTKKGQERFKYVINVIHSYIPVQLKWYFTVERLTNIIEKCVIKMKKQLNK